MRILPINFFYKTNEVRKSHSVASTNPNYSVLKPLSVDTVSFGRVAENAEPMRRLFKYGVIDIHTGKYVIDPDFYDNLLKNEIYDKSVKTIVKTLQPIKRCLLKTEFEVFTKIEQLAEKYPNRKLEDIVKMLAPKAQKELLEIQKPIFEELYEASKAMPPEQKKAFDELLDTTMKQLEHKPIVYKFSKKEFVYQLNRICKDIEQRNIPEEKKATKKLMSMASKIPYSPSGRNFARRRPKFDPNKSITQAQIIQQMDKAFSRSVLKDDKELKDLFERAKLQVFNIPTIIPFSKKTFIHNLETITDSLKDKKYAHRLIRISSKLPSMKNSIKEPDRDLSSSFITKSARNSSYKIFTDLLIRQKGAIDHIVPFSKGGPDDMTNYAFTSVGANSERNNIIMPKWMRENPTTYTGSQMCVNRLIELKNNGIFKKENVSPWYILQFVDRMEKQSPSDKKICFDIKNF